MSGTFSFLIGNTKIVTFDNTCDSEHNAFRRSSDDNAIDFGTGNEPKRSDYIPFRLKWQEMAQLSYKAKPNQLKEHIWKNSKTSRNIQRNTNFTGNNFSISGTGKETQTTIAFIYSYSSS